MISEYMVQNKGPGNRRIYSLSLKDQAMMLAKSRRKNNTYLLSGQRMHKDTVCGCQQFRSRKGIARHFEWPKISAIEAKVWKNWSKRFCWNPDFVRSLTEYLAQDVPCKRKIDEPTGWGPIGSVLTLKRGTATKAPLYLRRSTASRSWRAAWCSTALCWWK